MPYYVRGTNTSTELPYQEITAPHSITELKLDGAMPSALRAADLAEGCTWIVGAGSGSMGLWRVTVVRSWRGSLAGPVDKERIEFILR